MAFECDPGEVKFQKESIKEHPHGRKTAHRNMAGVKCGSCPVEVKLLAGVECGGAVLLLGGGEHNRDPSSVGSLRTAPSIAPCAPGSLPSTTRRPG